MGENLIDFKKIEVANVPLVNLNSQTNEESINKHDDESVFNEIGATSQGVKTSWNLVEIKEVEDNKEKKFNFFEWLWQKIFPPKTTETQNNHDEVESSEDNANIDADELLKIEDYKKLSQEDPKYTVNGEIDQDFYQGNAADCVLLANLYSLSRSENGKAIIKDAIKINYDENGNTTSYNVYFKGLDKTYNIPVEEYCEAERLRPRYQRGEVNHYLSAGDDDVLLMELAYQKAFNDITEAKHSSSIFVQTDALTSVQYEQFLYAFVGTEDVNTVYWIEEKYKEIQLEQNAPKILEIFETQKEFKLEDITKVINGGYLVAQVIFPSLNKYFNVK